MANKYDLRIKSFVPGLDDDEVLGAVPAGKTRFVCFYKIGSVSGTTVTLAADPVSAHLDAAGQKDVTTLAAAAILAFPDKVDVDNPLFSIAEGEFLNSNCGAVADVEMTVVYYDE